MYRDAASEICVRQIVMQAAGANPSSFSLGGAMYSCTLAMHQYLMRLMSLNKVPTLSEDIQLSRISDVAQTYVLGVGRESSAYP